MQFAWDLIQIDFKALLVLFQQEMIDEADRNGDGEIDESEFLRIMKKTSLYWVTSAAAAVAVFNQSIPPDRFQCVSFRRVIFIFVPFTRVMFIRVMKLTHSSFHSTSAVLEPTSAHVSYNVQSSSTQRIVSLSRELFVVSC